MQTIESPESNVSRVEIDTSGGVTKVILDGLDLSDRVTKVTFEHDSGASEWPMITLTLLCEQIHIRTVGNVCAKQYDLWVSGHLRKNAP